MNLVHKHLMSVYNIGGIQIQNARTFREKYLLLFITTKILKIKDCIVIGWTHRCILIFIHKAKAYINKIFHGV